MSYRSLKPEQIVETTRKLGDRVSERFPESGLTAVCRELLTVADKAAVTAEWIDRPILWLRIIVVVLLIVVLAVLVAAFAGLSVRMHIDSISDLVQAVEAAINDLIFVGLAIFFLVSWENRIKRRRALRAIHELRSMAHIIDMHQLTKDPERIMNTGGNTASSPVRKMTAFELTRYLDYCSEMLALISKIAAIYVQRFHDPVTLAAVNEMEDLTAGLSRKIWQKIMILDRFQASEKL